MYIHTYAHRHSCIRPKTGACETEATQDKYVGYIVVVGLAIDMIAMIMTMIIIVLMILIHI